MNEHHGMSEAIVGEIEVQPLITTQRRWLFRLICLGVCVALFLFGAIAILFMNERLVWDEDGPRFQNPPLLLRESGWKKTGHVYLFDKVLGWRNRPSWVATTNGKPLSINSLGLRGPECSLEKPDDTYRILVLGDSFGWGYGVGDDEVFSAVLQKECDRSLTQRVEVLNASVSGWGTDQQYIYFKNEGIHFQPDLVVLLFFPVNDVENNTHSVQYGMNKPMFFDLRLKDPRPVAEPGGFSVEKTFDGNPVELTTAIIREIANQCIAIDADLLVLKFGDYLFPANELTQASSQEIAETVNSIGDSVTFVDLDDLYHEEGISSATLVSGNDDGHWNAFGHRFTAEVIFDFLAGESHEPKSED